MGHQTLYDTSWDIVFDYLKDPGCLQKHIRFFSVVEPLIKQRLRQFGLHLDINGHTLSIFADLYKKEQKRYREGKLNPKVCTAKTTTYYYPVIKNLCIDYARLIKCKSTAVEGSAVAQLVARPGVFEGLWGEYQSVVLDEMNLYVADWIEHSNFEAPKKSFLSKRFLQNLKFPEILKGKGKVEFDAHRKWVQRQCKRLANEIASEVFPAIVDCHKLPISRKIDPRLIEKYLLGARIKETA